MKEHKTEIVGAILAAGKGSRVAQLPTRLPKPVLPILNQPVICHQLDAMHAVGIRKVFIVVGYRGYEVVREIERFGHAPDLSIEYIEQEETLGIAHSVGCLESRLDGPFFLFLGDIYFHAPRINELVEDFRDPGVDAVLGAIEEEDPALISRNYCILADATGRVTEVVEKPRFPRSRLKGVGLYLLGPMVFDAIRRTPRTAMRNEYEITDSLQILIDDGYNVRVSRAVERDLNITYPSDLLAANLWLLRHRGLSNAISSDAIVAEDAELVDVVVGSRATIGAGTSMKNCVVFSDSSVPDNQILEDAIVTTEGVLRA